MTQRRTEKSKRRKVCVKKERVNNFKTQEIPRKNLDREDITERQDLGLRNFTRHFQT